MGLSTRLALFASAVVLLSCAAVAVALTRAATADLRERLEERGETIARAISVRAAPAVQLGDRAALQALLDEMWEEDDVARVTVVGPKRFKLAERDNGLAADATVLYPVKSAPDADGYSDAVGMVHVALSARGLEARRERYIERAMRVAAAVAGAGVVLAVGVGWALAAPIRRLREATATVADGAYDAALDDLPRGGSTEVRALGEAFRGAVRAVADREAELLDVNQQLRDTEAARDAMTHMVIHDLKGPIANVLTVMAVIEAGQTDAEDRELVGEVRVRCRDLLRMIEDQLDLARLSQGRLDPSLERHEVGELIAGAVDAVRHLVSAAGFEVRYALPDDDLELPCDAALLERVLVNLVVNATRYGASPVTISAVPGDGCVTLAVEDAGEGVPDDLAETVFEPYRSLSDAGGAGLGLAFVRLAVEAHGGRVSVSGARFAMEFPA